MKNCWNLILAGMLSLLCTTVNAQSWEPIEDPEALRALFSDKVLEADLKGGSKAVARYNSDGTGVVQAWGETFNRTWEIQGNDQVCVVIDGKPNCFRVERNLDNAEEYRSHNLNTDEIIIFSVKPDGEPVAVDSATTNAGNASKPSADELAKELANPNTALATMNFKTQFRGFEGDLPNADNQDSFTLVFQPVLPFTREDGSKILFRPSFTYLSDQPVFNPGLADFAEDSGFGDIVFDLLYAPAVDPGRLWGYGLVGSLPTASDGLGSDRYAFGPDVVIGKLGGNYVVGSLFSHLWDTGGSGDADINTTSISAFYTYLPGGGWNLGSAPQMTYDWNAEQWTIPLNFNFGKTVTLGGRPWKLSTELNYYVEKPDAFGPEWLVGFNFGPVVKNRMADWFK